VRFRLFAISLLTAIVAGACGSNNNATPTQDLNAVFTQAAQLVSTQFAMQQTQTAMAASPAVQATTTLPPLLVTPTLPAFGTPGSAVTPFGFTPIPSAVATIPPSGSGSTAHGCNDAKLVDETIEDKTKMSPEKEFTKVWQMENTGTCTWGEGYVFTFLPDVSSPDLKGYDIRIKGTDATTAPKNTQSFVLKLVAPATLGEHISYWRMKDPQGNFFGDRVFVDIIVE
jgi:hypothetical protein